MKQLTIRSLATACRQLAAEHPIFAHVHSAYGVPPLWYRPPGFSTLLQIILEQQVSLASAKACFDKLAARLGEVSPASLLSLNDAEMRAVGFSRQKTAYARHLSEAVLEGRVYFTGLDRLPDVEVKNRLMTLKGVGEWTSDIYLLMAMLRPDVIPRGDVAPHTAWHKLSGNVRPTSDEFVRMAEKWSPYRSAAARLLWHYYLSEKRKPSQ